MFLAIVLGIWTLASIVVTPLIGYFLFFTSQQGNPPKRARADSRFRPAAWTYLGSGRQDYLRRAGQAKLHRREIGGPRAG
jgi:hypothetical protein